MPELVLALLVHNARPALDDLIANLHAFAPEAEVVVFNGGTDASLLDGVDARPLRCSRPLTYGNSSPFHINTFRELAGDGLDYDRIVTLDGDVALLRGGLEAGLRRIMGPAEYMAARFTAVDEDRRDENIRRYGFQAGSWRRLLAVDRLYRGFNPAQVFARPFVERILAHPHIDAIEAHLDRARLYGADELVWASLAAGLGAHPIGNPGERALVTRVHSTDELRGYTEDPDVFFVHKVLMDVGARDRTFVRNLWSGRDEPLRPPRPWSPERLPWRPFVRSRARDLAALSEAPSFWLRTRSLQR